MLVNYRAVVNQRKSWQTEICPTLLPSDWSMRENKKLSVISRFFIRSQSLLSRISCYEEVC